MAIPWGLLFRAVPSIAVGAKTVYDQWSARKGPPTDESKDKERIDERLTAIENVQRQQALVSKQIAEQLDAIAPRIAFAFWLSIVAVVLALGAIVIALVR